MTILLIIFYIIVCLFLVLVVLLQQGKGADLAGAFGGGGSQTAFGPRTSTNIMHRLTTVSFVLFVLLSLTLSVLSGREQASVMEEAAATTPTPTAEEAVEPGASAAPVEPAEAAAETGDPETESPVEEQDPAE